MKETWLEKWWADLIIPAIVGIVLLVIIFGVPWFFELASWNCDLAKNWGRGLPR